MPFPDDIEALGRVRFETTQWSLVLKAAKANEPEQFRAMEELCNLYWYPVYAFVRRQGMSIADAEDCTQDFFRKMITGSMLMSVAPEKGRFRSYLLTCCKHAMVNHWERQNSQKQGGQHQFIHLDLEVAEAFLQRENPSGSMEHDFDRQWAFTLLSHVERLLEKEYQEAGKGDIFTALRPHLLQEEEKGAYRKLAQTLAVSEGNLHVMLHRFRRSYRDILHREVLATLDDPADLKEEIHHLMKVLADKANP